VNWHEDFTTSHLSGESLRLANKVRQYLHDVMTPSKEFLKEFPDGDHGLNNCASGCPLFADKFSYVTGGGSRDYTSHDAGGVLHLVMDGGLLYDMYSPNGEGYTFGSDSTHRLEQFIESLGYFPEWATSYCLSIYKEE
jgi:hypothetical protein